MVPYVILLVTLLPWASSESSPHTHQTAEKRQTVDELEKCRDPFPRAKQLGIVVGIGWDDLRLMERSPVVETTFRLCKTTPDGKYLVPDNVMASNVKESYIDHMASFYKDYMGYLTSKTESFNVMLGVSTEDVGISGAFSTEHQDVKRWSVEHQSSILLTKVQYHAYAFILDPSYIVLSGAFKTRLMDIAKAVKDGRHDWARYWAQMLVSEYGTHVITKSTVGAERSNEVYVDTNAATDESTSLTEIQWAASASFFNTIEVTVSGGHKVSEEHKRKFDSMKRHSRSISKGAHDVISFIKKKQHAKRENFDERKEPENTEAQKQKNATNEQESQSGIRSEGSKYSSASRVYEGKYKDTEQTEDVEHVHEDGDEWDINVGSLFDGSNDLRYELVSLDRSGDPLYHLINKYMLPNVSLDILPKVAYWVKNATLEYYQRNTYHGCMDPQAKNFNFTANVHHQNACIFATTHNYTFGGIYQEMVSKYKTNLDWINGYLPPDRPDPWYVVNGITSQFGCPDGYGGQLAASKAFVANHYPFNYSTVNLHYCLASGKVHNRSGYMFGGSYWPGKANRVTKTESCPGRFVPVPVMGGLTLCLSRNYDMDDEFAIDFASFTSCQSQKTCPSGYTLYDAFPYRPSRSTPGDDCVLSYCVREGQLNRDLTTVHAKLPPYMKPPAK